MSAIPESHRDFFARPLVATLTTVGPDGLLQSTAVWYILDGDRICVSVRADRQKYRNLVRDPRANLFIMEPDNTTRTLEIRARVEIINDTDKSLADRFIPMYGKAPSTWDPPGAGRALLVIHPEHVTTLG